MAYPLDIRPDEDGTFVANFPDVPEALTLGETRDDALEWAADALHVAFTSYVEERWDIPGPSKPERGRPLVALPPPRLSLKLAIYQALRDQGVSQDELARCLECGSRQVRRLLDLDHDPAWASWRPRSRPWASAWWSMRKTRPRISP